VDIFVVFLAWLVADMQAAGTLVPLAAASQGVGYTATGWPIAASFTYCITRLYPSNRVLDKLLDRVLE